GVGSLLAAALQHYRCPGRTDRPALLSVEPRAAACLLASLTAGQPVTVHTGQTVLAGLNCGTVSTIAWPLAAAGLDAAVAVSDAQALASQRELIDFGVPAGACGAATLAGLASIAGLAPVDGPCAVGDLLGLGPTSTVVLISTDGPGPSGSGQ